MFYILETQVAKGSDPAQAAFLMTKKATRNEAESEYHRILQAAAVSSVYKHGAIIITEDCVPIPGFYQCYTHDPEQEET